MATEDEYIVHSIVLKRKGEQAYNPVNVKDPADFQQKVIARWLKLRREQEDCSDIL